MGKPCEWCIKTSESIDSIEYQNEQLIEAVTFLTNWLGREIDRDEDYIKDAVKFHCKGVEI